MSDSSPVSILHIHATCVEKSGRGVLLLGESGSGKSDLALRLLSAGWSLVADDQVLLQIKENELYASAPIPLQGMIEVYGLGVFQVSFTLSAKIFLALQLQPLGSAIERFPEIEYNEWLGVKKPQISLCAFHASAVQKLDIYMSKI